ncbi:GvpL/GvpF family gas vesicle protein [Nocardiopsis sp. ATB16-24]|uniref:GvpL/GvpF family gas vesicle protein n=1 Tax=Nocardiopsis sp. ATB16-24 TaxID=3019555 RepID=UPI0025576966|nr:GvpL/GvpF family gas vesicle protein [Nocardiopsis sp. ATB16-24]
MGPPEYADYVYAVCRPFDAGAVDGLTGVGGHPVHVVTEARLTAVVSTVPLHEFGEQALRNSLEDLRWLEEVARAHHGVVEAVGRRTVTVPLRLATVYHSDERVREVLREHGEAFEAALRELAGRVELGVKVYAEAPAPSVPPARPSSGEANPGRAYLRRRKEQRDRRDDTWQRAVELCERADEVLGGLAWARERHRPQSAALSEASGENVMNNAYLVDEERVEAFLATARELDSHAPEGVRIEVSGPWAPYSFATGRPSEVNT